LQGKEVIHLVAQEVDSMKTILSINNIICSDGFINSMERSDSGGLVRKMSDENLEVLEKISVLGFTTPLSTNMLLCYSMPCCCFCTLLLYDCHVVVFVPYCYMIALCIAIGWFFSVAGTEYCHTYFWIAKDLAWMQGWRLIHS